MVLLVTEDGALYSYGITAFNQLGYAVPARFSARPQRVPFPPGCSVVQASAGTSHCLAVDALGYVFAWGCNSAGQCGLANEAAGVVTDEAGNAVVPTPTLLLGLPKMVACYAGDGFSVLLGEAGDV